jgi:hemerythrin-like domain-containing protein
MLTATYSLVALSVEQEKAQIGLCELEQFIKKNSLDPVQASPEVLEAALNQLSSFEQYCHERKMEIFVIPALRKATREADPLLEELESLSRLGRNILSKVREGLRSAFQQGRDKVKELCHSLQLYCTHLFLRLRKEEELVQIAQRVIPAEEWFDIAAQFLTHDEREQRRQRYARMVALAAAP